MALPGDVTSCVVTGTFQAPDGTPLKGTVSLTPSVPLLDPGDSVTIWPVSRTYELSGGSFVSAPLVSTDSTQVMPPGWWYEITVSLQNSQPYTFSAFLFAADSPLDISEITPVSPVTQMGAYVPITGGTMEGPLYAASAPSSPNQVATMSWVESITAGLAAKGSALVATAAALPANTATPLTLTANFTGALTVDGVAVPLNARVLVKNEVTAANNGIFVLSQLGTSMEPYILTRSSDMDANAQVPGAYTFVEEGTANAGFGFIVSGIGPYVLGTTAIAWEQFTSTGDFTAGAGLTLSGDVVSLNSPIATSFLPAATTGAQGVIGPLPGGSTEFLRADGTWDVPPGSGITGTVTVTEGGTGATTAAGALAAVGVTSEYPVINYAGADPSGATDSTAAVEAAQSAALDAGGGYVVFGPGTWKFQPVVIAGVSAPAAYTTPPLVHFRFAGPGATVLTPLNANAPLFGVSSGTPHAAGVRFEGGFTVKAHASGSTGPAIDLSGARQWVIESPSYLDSSEGTSGSPGTYNSVIGFGVNTYACRVANPVCEGQKLGTCFIGAKNPATVVANNNMIENPLFESCTASYMIDAAGTAELNVSGGIIEGNTVTAAIRLGYQTRVRGVHFEGNAAYAMDAHGTDGTDPGQCWLENNLYNYAFTLSIPSGTYGANIFIGSLGDMTVSDATASYLSIAGAVISAGGSLELKTPLRHFPVISGTTSGNVTLDPRAGDYQRIAPTGNITIEPTTGDQSDGQDLTIEVTQPASGGPFTVGWAGAFVFNGGTAPAASVTAGAVDVFAFRWNATAARWIERYRRLSYFTSLQAANNLSDVASTGAARANLGISGSGIQDPLVLGFNSVFPMATVGTGPAGAVGANSAYYLRLVSGGYTSASVILNVTTSSGNISVAYYTTSGSGTSAQPTGGQQQTTGAVACPAAGNATLSLGAAATPNLPDWLAISMDNATAGFTCLSGGSNTALVSGLEWYQPSGAHPLPATPSSLSADSYAHVMMRSS